jgi:hypothetical protein
MIVTKSNRKEFLQTQTHAYQSGWFHAERGFKHPVKLVAPQQIVKEFEIGFHQCKENSEICDAIAEGAA